MKIFSQNCRIILVASVIVLLVLTAIFMTHFRKDVEAFKILTTTRTVGNVEVTEFEYAGSQIQPAFSQTSDDYGIFKHYKGVEDDQADNYILFLFDTLTLTGSELTNGNLAYTDQFILNGNYVFWLNYIKDSNDEPTGTEFSMYNRSTQTTTMIDNDGWKGDIVIQKGGTIGAAIKSSSSSNSVVLYNFTTSPITSTTICNASGIKSSLNGSDNLLAWNDPRNKSTNQMDIYGYDIQTSSSITVASTPLDEMNPVCNSRYILYIVKSSNGDFVRLYDKNTHSTTTLASNVDLDSSQHGISPYNPTGDTYVAWTEKYTNNGNTLSRVAYRTLASSTINYIQDTSCDVVFNDISSTHIAWTKIYRESYGDPESYEATLTRVGVRKLSNSTDIYMDDDVGPSAAIRLGAENAMWVAARGTGNNQSWNICGAALP